MGNAPSNSRVLTKFQIENTISSTGKSLTMKRNEFMSQLERNENQIKQVLSTKKMDNNLFTNFGGSNVTLVKKIKALNLAISCLTLLLNNSQMVQMGQRDSSVGNQLRTPVNNILFLNQKIQDFQLTNFSQRVSMSMGINYVKDAENGVCVNRDLVNAFRFLLPKKEEIAQYWNEFIQRNKNNSFNGMNGGSNNRGNMNNGGGNRGNVNNGYNNGRNLNNGGVAGRNMNGGNNLNNQQGQQRNTNNNVNGNFLHQNYNRNGKGNPPTKKGKLTSDMFQFNKIKNLEDYFPPVNNFENTPSEDNDITLSLKSKNVTILYDPENDDLPSKKIQSEFLGPDPFAQSNLEGVQESMITGVFDGEKIVSVHEIEQKKKLKLSSEINSNGVDSPIKTTKYSEYKPTGPNPYTTEQDASKFPEIENRFNDGNPTGKNPYTGGVKFEAEDSFAQFFNNQGITGAHEKIDPSTEVGFTCKPSPKKEKTTSTPMESTIKFVERTPFDETIQDVKLASFAKSRINDAKEDEATIIKEARVIQRETLAQNYTPNAIYVSYCPTKEYNDTDDIFERIGKLHLLFVSKPKMMTKSENPG